MAVSVEALPGANTPCRTLEETRANLQETVELALEANRSLADTGLSCKKSGTPSRRVMRKQQSYVISLLYLFIKKAL